MPYRTGEGGAYGFDFLLVAILRARPEETLESILAPARDDVYVEMGDALADAVVYGDQGAFGAERFLDGAAERLGALEERRDVGGREVGERFDVAARDEQDVAGEKGPVIEEGEGSVVLVDDGRGNGAGRDLAEGAGGRHVSMMAPDAGA
jgi:hypothetical protein